VTTGLGLDRTLWRVGYYADPLGFAPLELYGFNHRFDDIQQRFRTIYSAQLPETALREVLADFRPNLGAIRRHVDRYGPEAAQDVVAEPVTAQWRTQQVLVPLTLQLDGPLIDLTDVPTRQDIEQRHRDLLLQYDLQHLDMPEITTRRRPVTQTIAAHLFDEGVSAVRFPSKLDGNPCFAVFEGRGSLVQAGDPIALTDPPPEALTNVAGPWGLQLEPAPAAVRP
jgi:hypothetical protein